MGALCILPGRSTELRYSQEAPIEVMDAKYERVLKASVVVRLQSQLLLSFNTSNREV